MRVLLSPGAEQTAYGPALAASLAGDDGDVVRSTALAVRTLKRRLSQAEVHALRKALLGLGPGDALQVPPPVSGAWRTVGYVCCGSPAPGAEGSSAPIGGARGGISSVAVPTLLAVTDHANLTWRSPLTGPNDDRLGPRFPVVAGVYRPEVVVAQWESVPLGGDWSARRPVTAGVVAEVRDEDRLTAFEQAVVERHAFDAVSSELAAVAILAAHLRLALAAGVVVT